MAYILGPIMEVRVTSVPVRHPLKATPKHVRWYGVSDIAAINDAALMLGWHLVRALDPAAHGFTRALAMAVRAIS